ncbi:MAG TPA: cytochrome c [Cyclobacteriaceae bacterium]|nr:cytochrome c [Cyclobacteriaceae bacterium]
MKTKKPTAFIFAILTAILFLSYTTVSQDRKPWVVPDNAKKMKNPVKVDDEAISIGKSLYAKHCKSCHGKNGEGDGTKAAELKTPPGDFTTKEFHDQTDGELFYKTTEGRDDMPEFKKKIASDEDRWILVHYIRTLKK